MIAPGLSEAELRVALYLATIQDPQTHTAKASSREIEASTRVARRNVQRALDSLSRRSLIAARQGGGQRSSVYLLNFTQTTGISGGVTTTPPAQTALQFQPPEVASLRRHPSEPQPPLDIDLNRDSILDRTLTARPQHFQTSELALVKSWAYKWLILQRDQANAQPPDDLVCAQIATAAGSPLRAVDWIRDHLTDRQAENCAYLVSALLQQIHHIAPPNVRRRRAELRVVARAGKPTPGPEPAADPQFAADLVSQAIAATGKIR